MSKLNDLINELCPDGVEYKTIEEVFEIRNGYTPSKNKPEYWEHGTIPWFRMEDIRKNGRILADSIQHITPSAIKGSGLFHANSIIIATTATIGEHALIIADSLANQRFTNLKVRKSLSDKLLSKFVFYYMFVIDKWCKENVNASSFASVDMKRFRQVEFPLPPLPIQEEIVRILDNFSELEAELEAELDCRKRQYEFYRDKLLSFEDGSKVEWKKMSEICKIMNGKDYKHLSEGQIPVYGSGGIMTYVDEYAYDKPSVLIPRKGSIGNLFYVEEPFWTVDTIYWTKIDDATIFPKFFYYFMTTKDLTKLNMAAGVPSLTQSMLYKIKIPIPSLSEQQRIVSILDRFEALSTDLQKGLPAEIAARRQQYEYYRDKLLTFKKK